MTLLSAGLTLAQTQTTASGRAAADAAAQGTQSLQAGTKMNAELKSKLDTKNAHVGDSVTAVTTSAVKEHGTTVLPKGSVLHGHVTEVQSAADSHSAARLGVLFDQATTKKGETIPMHAGIASIFSSSAAAGNISDGMSDGGMMQPMAMPVGGGARAGGGGLLGGGGAALTGAVGGIVSGAGAGVNTAANTMGHIGAAGAQGQTASMARASNGVPVQILLPPASAAGAASGSGAASVAGIGGASGQASSGSVLASSQGNMQLNSGTRMSIEVVHP
ncbi:MAG TPA: hypothetical protein VN709_11080 [Terriglobales bacterium]|nr:hypothetical protein [Terriglobales bacterium]